jgi:plastocyanin
MFTIWKKRGAAVGRSRKLRAMLVALGVGQMALAASILTARAFATDASIKIDNFAFDAEDLIVPVGTKVVWRNVDDAPHSIIAANREFHSKALDTNDEFSFTFAQAGEFIYFCGLHPFMKGKVIVKP